MNLEVVGWFMNKSAFILTDSLVVIVVVSLLVLICYSAINMNHNFERTSMELIEKYEYQYQMRISAIQECEICEKKMDLS